MQEVLDLLKSLGWQDAGITQVEQVRIPTTRCPVFGGIGGELRTLGGRLRLALPGTDHKVTVGKRTACFYGNGEMKNVRTKDLDAVRGEAESRAASRR